MQTKSQSAAAPVVAGAGPDDRLHRVREQIKDLLVDDLDIHLERSQIGDTTPLMEEGLALDSVVLIELISHLENRFDFHFRDEHLREAAFSNVTTLAELILAQNRSTES